jgi:hypothetical protein
VKAENVVRLYWSWKFILELESKHHKADMNKQQTNEKVRNVREILR